MNRSAACELVIAYLIGSLIDILNNDLIDWCFIN